MNRIETKRNVCTEGRCVNNIKTLCIRIRGYFIYHLYFYVGIEDDQPGRVVSLQRSLTHRSVGLLDHKIDCYIDSIIMYSDSFLSIAQSVIIQ
jgi:hypothetical protein